MAELCLDALGPVSNAMQKACAGKMGKMVDNLQPKSNEEIRGEIPVDVAE